MCVSVCVSVLQNVQVLEVLFGQTLFSCFPELLSKHIYLYISVEFSFKCISCLVYDFHCCFSLQPRSFLSVYICAYVCFLASHRRSLPGCIFFLFKMYYYPLAKYLGNCIAYTYVCTLWLLWPSCLAFNLYSCAHL